MKFVLRILIALNVLMVYHWLMVSASHAKKGIIIINYIVNQYVVMELKPLLNNVMIVICLMVMVVIQIVK